MERLPLAGLRVADFSWMGAGSYATKMLADFGAEVIKIESMANLDNLRMSRPFKDKIPGVNRSGYFADRNTSKRSMTINMKHEKGKLIARQLIAQSDIVCNNFTPGVMERFGLGYEEVAAFKANIVYISMSMQGNSGPHRDYLGYGMTMGALTGLQHLTGAPDREPAGTGTNYPDHIPNPCHAVVAIMASLIHRDSTGEGQYIDLAQTEPTLALLGPVILDYTVNGRVQQRRANRHDYMSPHGIYPCHGDDRWIAIAVETDAQWRALASVLGMPLWMTEATWSSAEQRLAKQSELDDRLATETCGWDNDELMLALQVHGVAAGSVRDVADILEKDAQLAHRGHWLRLDHPEMGRTIYNAQPMRMSDLAVTPTRPAPMLGADTEDICVSLLGMNPKEVAALQEEGALR